jgi:hypothetical protein
LLVGERPTLTRADFDPPPRPAGAFDAPPEVLSERLSPNALNSLNALSRDSMRQVRDHLSRRLAGDEDDPDDSSEDSVNSGDIGGEIIDFLESCGLDPKIIERVKGLIDSGNGDGELLLQHKGDQDPTGFDPTMSRSAAGAMGPGMDDTVPAFPGKPEVGGGQVPLSDRRMALDSMARIRIADDAGVFASRHGHAAAAQAGDAGL